MWQKRVGVRWVPVPKSQVLRMVQHDIDQDRHRAQQLVDMAEHPHVLVTSTCRFRFVQEEPDPTA